VYSISKVCFHLPHLCENQVFLISSWTTMTLIPHSIYNNYIKRQIVEPIPILHSLHSAAAAHLLYQLQLSRKGAVSVSVSHRSCIHEESSETGHRFKYLFAGT